IGVDGIQFFVSGSPFALERHNAGWTTPVCLPTRASPSTGARLPNVSRRAECSQDRATSRAFVALLISEEGPVGLLLRWRKLGQILQSRSRTCQQSRRSHNAM